MSINNRHYVDEMSSFNNETNSPPYIPHTAKQTAMPLIPNYEDHWMFEAIALKRVPGISLGFSVAGGIDNPMYGNNTSIFVTKLSPGGLAELDGRLRINDILYKVNDVVLDEVDHLDAVQALRDAGKIVNLVF